MNRLFAAFAPELARYGLAVIPVGGDDGKRPLVRWPLRAVGPNSVALAVWARDHPSANIGVLTKPSKLTVVDVDDPAIADEIERRFGFTPIVTRTASGGFHFLYRAKGETSRNLRASEGLPVDVKGGGASKGGFIVVPPSRRPSGQHAGKQYYFERGTWDDLARLPGIRVGSLPEITSRFGERDPHAEVVGDDSFAGAVVQGERNETLFRKLKSVAQRLASFEELLHIAADINLGFSPPVADAEVVRTAKSVWRYRERGELWEREMPRYSFTKDELDAVFGDANALMLGAYLKTAHGLCTEPFAISAKAMSKASVIPRWRIDRYRSARNSLLEFGLLHQVRQGGKGPNDPSLYRFP